MQKEKRKVNSLLIANSFAASVMADLGALLKDNKRVYRLRVKGVYNALYAKMEENNESVRIYVDDKTLTSMLDIYDKAEGRLYPIFISMKRAIMDELEAYNVSQLNIISQAYAVNEMVNIGNEIFEELTTHFPFLKKRKNILSIGSFVNPTRNLLDMLWRNITMEHEAAPTIRFSKQREELKSKLYDLDMIEESIRYAINIHEKDALLNIG